MTKLIPIAKPQILKSDVNLASKAIKDGWDHKHVFYVDKFERKFKQKVSAKYSPILPKTVLVNAQSRL